MPKRTIIALTMLLTAPFAAAWNDTGHMLVALIAYERLDVQARTRLVGILRKHPRFQEDFARKMPPGLSDSDTDRWIFAHAATWPDIARGLKGSERKKYHHANWHYVNKPLFLSPEDEADLRGADMPNTSDVLELGAADGTLNALQALKKSLAELSDASADDRTRAVALCWILHLVGDLHQPLHTVALFSAERFPDGDKGGNGIPIGPTSHKSLHSLWDGLVGEGRSMTFLTRKLRAALADADRRASAEAALARVSPVGWMDEGAAIASESVYGEDILDAVSAAERRPEKPLRPIDVDDAYMDAARDVALDRAVIGGYRLAAVLTQ